jgi:hypothetical protein
LFETKPVIAEATVFFVQFSALVQDGQTVCCGFVC